MFEIFLYLTKNMSFHIPVTTAAAMAALRHYWPILVPGIWGVVLLCFFLYFYHSYSFHSWILFIDFLSWQMRYEKPVNFNKITKWQKNEINTGHYIQLKYLYPPHMHVKSMALVMAETITIISAIASIR